MYEDITLGVCIDKVQQNKLLPTGFNNGVLNSLLQLWGRECN